MSQIVSLVSVSGPTPTDHNADQGAADDDPWSRKEKAI
jgi:hypothetical protein